MRKLAADIQSVLPRPEDLSHYLLELPRPLGVRSVLPPHVRVQGFNDVRHVRAVRLADDEPDLRGPIQEVVAPPSLHSRFYEFQKPWGSSGSFPNC